MSVERHYFPGNNTPLGFFSYYKFIIGQREANRIVCIKGGPGTGKSTFMRKLGEHFKGKGEDVDFLHCSADENSLDGVVLRKRKVAFIDGTSPHITDPVTPGAVDRIVNLGEYWNEKGIEASRDEIIDLNEETSRWYRVAYNYLNAAKSVYRSLEEIYNEAAEAGEVYSLVAETAGRVYGGRSICMQPGRVKKFFAGAVTGNGIVNYIPSLLSNVEKIYMINVPVGYGNGSFMEIISEGAVYRGLDIEAFYCPMCPEEKIEHVIIPELKTAFVTANRYHDLEPWEITSAEGAVQDVSLIDMNDYMKRAQLCERAELIESLNGEYDMLLDKAVTYLAKAKETHLAVESKYVPNMNFKEISSLLKETIAEIEQTT